MVKCNIVALLVVDIQWSSLPTEVVIWVLWILNPYKVDDQGYRPVVVVEEE